MKRGWTQTRPHGLLWLLGALACAVVVFGLLRAPRNETTDPVTPDRGAGRPPAAKADGTQATAPRAELPATLPKPPARATRHSPTILSGSVVRPDGAPVAAAEVLLLERDADAFLGLDLEYASMYVERGRTRTAADGRFAFPVARARPMRIRASANGLAPAEVPCRGGQELRVVLCPGAAVHVTVHDQATRQPVSDARVTVWGGDEWLRAPTCEGKTDTRGAFRAAGLAAGRCQVQVVHPSAREASREIVLESGRTHDVHVLLDGSGLVKGRVLDASTGLPIADAEVSDVWTFARTVRSNADGHYALRGPMHAALREVHARAAGFARTMLVPGPAREQTLDILLQPAGRVRGRAMSATGAPLGNAYVALAGLIRSREGLFHCDWLRAAVQADGSFEVANVACDRDYFLLARAPDHGTRDHLLPRRTDPGGTLDVGDVALRPAATLEGVVVDRAGVARPDVQVRLRGGNADQYLWRPGATQRAVDQLRDRVATTDADGHFAFTDLAGGSYQVTARRALPWRFSGSPNVEVEVTLADGDTKDALRLVLERGLWIAGRVLDARGQPLGPGSVHASRDGSTYAYARIDVDGGFRLEEVPAGAFRLDFADLPEPWVVPPLHGVHAGEPAVRAVGVEGVWITGTVLGPDGVPRPGLAVRVSAIGDPQGMKWNLVSDECGAFRHLVPPGTRVRVDACDPLRPEVCAEGREVPGGTRDLVLRLR